MTTMFNVQRGDVTIPVNATGGNMPMAEPANVLYLGTMSYDDVASDGTLVIASTNHPMQGKASEFGIGFFKANGDPVLNQNYAVTITQKNTVVFSDLNGHTNTGMINIITSPMPSASEPISLTVTLNGIGLATDDPSTWTGVKDVTLNFAQGAIPEASPVTTNTTSTATSNTPSPEYGPLAPIILTVAILSVIIFARAKLPKSQPSFLVSSYSMRSGVLN